MATKIRGAQIKESIAGVGLELDGNTLNVLIDDYTLRTTHSGGPLEVTAVNLQSSMDDGATSGLTVSGTTNGTVGQALYVDSSGDWALAKADAESTMPVAAMAVDSNTALTYGYIRNDAWDWTPGGLIYASTATAGALTQDVPTASGSQVQVVGIAISADIMFFNPDLTTVELGDSPFYTKEELTTSGVLDVRYYTEDEIDALITSTSGAIIKDHGELEGLSDDDHTQYILEDGSRAFSGTVSGVTPVEDAHLATKGYVDTLVTTVSGDILSYVSDNYIDNSEMTTISGHIIDYIDAATASGAIDHGELAGLADDDHTQYLLADGTRNLSGDLLPNASGTVDLGSAAAPYGEIHADDVFIKGSSLHIDGYAINEFSNDETLADASYSALPTEYAVKNYVDDEISSVSGSLTDDIIWEVVDTPTEQIRPKAAHMGKAIYTSGNLTIGGDLTVSGTTTTIHSQELTVADKIITVNYGEVGAGMTGDPQAGIEIDRGSESNYLFIFDERSDNFRVGVSGTQSSFNDYPLQPVATREETPTNTRVAWWDASNYTFRTHGDTYVTINSGTDTIVMAVSDTTEVTIDTDGFALKTGADVNEISTAVSAASTDDQLATAKAIYDYIDTVSGSISGSIGAIDHNDDLNGLQGGNGSDQYYHLNSTAYTALSGVDSAQVGTWDTAYGWGNHASVGYLTSESDPVFGASPAAGITASGIANWNTAYGWGDHAGLYDTVGTAAGLIGTHESTYAHVTSYSADNFTTSGSVLAIKDDGVAEAELVIGNEPVDGHYLQYTTASGMVWTDVHEEGIIESEIKLQNESDECDGVETDFTLDDEPVANSLQVYLNGLLQEKGVGKDYTHSVTTVSFTVAPLAGDILIIHYTAKS